MRWYRLRASERKARRKALGWLISEKTFSFFFLLLFWPGRFALSHFVKVLPDVFCFWIKCGGLFLQGYGVLGPTEFVKQVRVGVKIFGVRFGAGPHRAIAPFKCLCQCNLIGTVQEQVPGVGIPFEIRGERTIGPIFFYFNDYVFAVDRPFFAGTIPPQLCIENHTI